MFAGSPMLRVLRGLPIVVLALGLLLVPVFVMGCHRHRPAAHPSGDVDDARTVPYEPRDPSDAGANANEGTSAAPQPEPVIVKPEPSDVRL